MFIETGNRSTSGPAQNGYTLFDGDSLIVARTGIINVRGAGSRGIDALGQVTVLVSGEVYSSREEAIWLVNNSRLTITETGIVASGKDYAIRAFDGADVDNAGYVSGAIYGLDINDSQRNDNVFVKNSGSIAGSLGGVAIEGLRISFVNSGQISGPVAIILSGGFIAFNNSGTVNSSVNAIDARTAGRAEMTNTGLIIGQVQLTNGSDFFDTSEGIVDGRIQGFGGDDFILGSATPDQIDGGLGADVLQGLAGDDLIFGEDGNDTIEGGDGADDLVGGAGADSIDGGLGDDFVAGDTGLDRLRGGDGNDSLYGGGGADMLDGGVGLDYAGYSFDGPVTASLADPGVNSGAAAGDDYESIEGLLGSAFADTLIGDAGANRLDGGAGGDILQGGAGNDVYFIDSAGDVIVEDANGGWDTVFVTGSYSGLVAVEVLRSSDVGSVSITGSGSNNRIIGGDAGDFLDGGLGVDRLQGLAGNDTLYGNFGADWLQGGDGADIFRIAGLIGAGQIDTIADFRPVDDTFGLNGSALVGIGAPGVLDASRFTIGSAATTAQQRIIYNNGTGALLFDADGSGVKAAIGFATVQPFLAITAADFLVG
jgi:Ca2+-binding RTX toxin-like protein